MGGKRRGETGQAKGYLGQMLSLLLPAQVFSPWGPSESRNRADASSCTHICGGFPIKELASLFLTGLHFPLLWIV